MSLPLDSKRKGDLNYTSYVGKPIHNPSSARIAIGHSHRRKRRAFTLKTILRDLSEVLLNGVKITTGLLLARALLGHLKL